MLLEILLTSTTTNAKADILQDNCVQHPGWELTGWLGREQFCKKEPGNPGRQPLMC